ncbi:isocitrate/isopropylmalate dehydrogenase family protein [Rivihabitans pingtungensis]|uniref:Homoisocitrate dehydrogenase n=1 Tax=Rivihabitans pingtungensis TaxID=1054498 RepID=A0A318KKH4_9NEIS|nr:isocitrate/isopropylmalate family dehydrogenase [Rivihabitans pingtungensis]PXX78341.1 homoisocitrate dehydrogenase [Rivihabitans pingtungensis]
MKLCLIPGDGIGREVVPVAAAALQRLLPAVQLQQADAGWECFVRTGQALPDATLARARECGAVLFGAVSSPARKVEGYRSPIVALRRELNAYANLRPTCTLPIAGARQDVDMLIVRENTEDLYIGEEQRDGDTAIAIKRITAAASRRVARAACETLLARGMHRLVIVHKANIMPLTDGLFRDCCREVAQSYPQIEVSELLVDTAAYQLARAPQQFQALVAPNLYGDILSDLAAAHGGGLGLAASLNQGDAGVAIAEPVHGSAPDIAGQGVANPVAALLSVALLLRHTWQRPDEAQRLEHAVRDTLAAGIATPDVAGAAGVSTAAFAQALLARL